MSTSSSFTDSDSDSDERIGPGRSAPRRDSLGSDSTDSAAAAAAAAAAPASDDDGDREPDADSAHPRVPASRLVREPLPRPLKQSEVYLWQFEYTAPLTGQLRLGDVLSLILTFVPAHFPDLCAASLVCRGWLERVERMPQWERALRSRHDLPHFLRRFHFPRMVMDSADAAAFDDEASRRFGEDSDDDDDASDGSSSTDLSRRDSDDVADSAVLGAVDTALVRMGSSAIAADFEEADAEAARRGRRVRGATAAAAAAASAVPGETSASSPVFRSGSEGVSGALALHRPEGSADYDAFGPPRLPMSDSSAVPPGLEFATGPSADTVPGSFFEEMARRHIRRARVRRRRRRMLRAAIAGASTPHLQRRFATRTQVLERLRESKQRERQFKFDRRVEFVRARAVASLYFGLSQLFYVGMAFLMAWRSDLTSDVHLCAAYFFTMLAVGIIQLGFWLGFDSKGLSRPTTRYPARIMFGAFVVNVVLMAQLLGLTTLRVRSLDAAVSDHPAETASTWVNTTDVAGNATAALVAGLARTVPSSLLVMNAADWAWNSTNGTAVSFCNAASACVEYAVGFAVYNGTDMPTGAGVEPAVVAVTVPSTDTVLASLKYFGTGAPSAITFRTPVNPPFGYFGFDGDSELHMGTWYSTRRSNTSLWFSALAVPLLVSPPAESLDSQLETWRHAQFVVAMIIVGFFCASVLTNTAPRVVARPVSWCCAFLVMLAFNLITMTTFGGICYWHNDKDWCMISRTSSLTLFVIGICGMILPGLIAKLGQALDWWD